MNNPRVIEEHSAREVGLRFPRDFKWGYAASAYQIEGAAAMDGRGRSVWDTFARQPGAVVNGETGDVACDHYHRYREDVALMAEHGARAYRFSISWPRVLPLGVGQVNRKGVDFYHRLVDSLLEAGIEPTVNLFHWDLPQALQDRRGFANPQSVGWFTDYTALMANELGDRVTDWMTFNEPAVYAFLGHVDGIHAPGIRDWPTGIRVADNQLRAHAAAGDVIRSVVASARVGVAFDVNRVAPLTDSDRDVRAAAEASATRDAWFLDPLFGRGYPLAGKEAHEAAGHLEGVELDTPPDGKLDYLGLNYYRQDNISARSDEPFDWEIVTPPDVETTEMGWHVQPRGLTDTLLDLTREYSPREIMITENGAAYDDKVDPDGAVRDTNRVSYLARHLGAIADARDGGAPVTGYFVWSMMDNYEWSLGYGKRFGVIRVDFNTLARTPKESARWYRDVTEAGR